MAIRNLDWVRGLRVENVPDFGAKLYESLSDLDRHLGNVTEQTNANRTGQPLSPPAPNTLNVIAQDGHFHAEIADGGKFYRGIHYYIEHADNPSFQNPVTVHLGSTRSWDKFLGNSTRYFRAYSAYGSSPAGPPVYHGSVVAPQPVTGGGSIPGPKFLPSQGSGTGTPGQGGQGPGSAAYRSPTGAPPVRGVSTLPAGGPMTLAANGLPIPLAGVSPTTAGGSGGGSGGGGGGVVGGPNFSDSESPSGALNGINVAFGLANSPSPALSLLLSLNGQLQQQGAGKDYTVSGATITMAIAPVSTDALLAWYRF